MPAMWLPMPANKGKEKKEKKGFPPNGDFSPGGKYENMVF